MPETIGRGGTTTSMDVYFRSGAGTLVDPVTPLVDVIDPSAVVVVNNAVPTRLSTGRYIYDYTVPLDAPLGLWMFHWTATINGAPVSGDDYLTVEEAGTVDVVGPGPIYPAYATPDDLELFTGITPPTDAARMLQRASELIDALPMRAFPITLAGLPVLATDAVALRDATCAVVESWVNAGGDAIATSTVSFSLGELTVGGSNTAQTIFRPIPERALAILWQAGLLGAGVATIR